MDKATKIDSGLSKEQQNTQKLLRQMDTMQKKFGGRLPEYVNMYFAAKLECLTKALVWMTAILGMAAVAQIVVLIVVAN